MNERVKELASYIPCTGLWCVEVWLYYVVSFIEIPYGLPWQFPYAVLMVSAFIVVGFGVLCGRNEALYEKCKNVFEYLDHVTVAFACIGTFAAGASLFSYGVSPFVSCVGLAVGSYFAGSQFVQWGVLYSTADTSSVAKLVVLQGVIGAVVFMFLMMIPPECTLIVACLLPLASYVSLKVSARVWPQFEPHPSIFSARQLMGMWRIWVVLLGTTLIMGVLGYASISCFSMPPRALLLLQKMTFAGLGLCLLAWMIKSKSSIDFAFLWRVVMIAIGVLLAVVASDPSHFVFELLVTTLYSIMHIFFLVTICGMVGRTKLAGLNGHIFVGLLMGAYFGILVIAAPVSDLLGFTDLEHSVPLLFLLLVIIASSSWGASDFALRAMSEDTGGDSDLGTSRKTVTLSSLCDRASERYSLTRREAEILGMLLLGRTRTYIAETLFISENTVKTHVSSIYNKLGVHSKKELRDLLGL